MSALPPADAAPDGADRRDASVFHERAVHEPAIRTSDAASSERTRCATLYAALLGERLPADVLVRQWLAGSGAGTLAIDLLEVLPQPGTLASLDRIDAARHGPDGPVRADWPPLLRVAGTVRYVAMVALALHEHGVWRSSRPASELDPVAAAMLPIVPEAWRPALMALRTRAQVV